MDNLDENVRRILDEGKAKAKARRKVALMNWDQKLIKVLPAICWIFSGVLVSHFFLKPVEVIRHPRHIPTEEYIKIHDSVYIVRTVIDSVYYDLF